MPGEGAEEAPLTGRKCFPFPLLGNILLTHLIQFAPANSRYRFLSGSARQKKGKTKGWKTAEDQDNPFSSDSLADYEGSDETSNAHASSRSKKTRACCITSYLGQGGSDFDFSITADASSSAYTTTTVRELKSELQRREVSAEELRGVLKVRCSLVFLYWCMDCAHSIASPSFIRT